MLVMAPPATAAAGREYLLQHETMESDVFERIFAEKSPT